MRKQVKRDLLELVHLVPKEKQDAAAMLLNEIVFLQKPLADVKRQVESNADTASIKNYDMLCKRYSALIKQAMDLIPKTASGETPDALTEFNKDADRHNIKRINAI